MLVILPFETDFYKKFDYEVTFVGHPLLDALSNITIPDSADFRQKWNLGAKPIIALLPGSRKQEIKTKLPLMLSVRKDFPDYQFVVAGAPGLEQSFYRPFLDKDVHWVENDTYNLLQLSRAALVTSGTATLETALLKIPEVVCYKGNRISYEIGKRLVKHIKYISLVNLIMDEEIVTELIQNELNYKNLKRELSQILDKDKREKLDKKYHLLRDKLGGSGASERAAIEILETIS